MEILGRCGIEQINPALQLTEPWSTALFGDEQQRLSFARVLSQPADILIMDEPIPSLDDLSQFRLMEYMRGTLPEAKVIHAGHRVGLAQFRDGQIQLVRSGSQA